MNILIAIDLLLSFGIALFILAIIIILEDEQENIIYLLKEK